MLEYIIDGRKMIHYRWSPPPSTVPVSHYHQREGKIGQNFHHAMWLYYYRVLEWLPKNVYLPKWNYLPKCWHVAVKFQLE